MGQGVYSGGMGMGWNGYGEKQISPSPDVLGPCRGMFLKYDEDFL